MSAKEAKFINNFTKVNNTCHQYTGYRFDLLVPKGQRIKKILSRLLPWLIALF
jgi:hypothetical protein